MSNGNGITDTIDRETLAHSVTRAEKEAQRPEGGMVKFYIGAYSGGTSTVFQQLPDLPPYWSFIRDRILVSTVTVESRWAQACGIAAMKFATRNWDVSGEVPTTRLDKARRRVRILMKPQNRMKVAVDYTLRDNGAWVEIVRPTSQPTGVIGLNPLDASRCMPTGDPTIPVVYWDRLGHPHEMRDYQVMRFVDMPDGANPFGTGLCAARRAYNTIRQTAAVERFRLEKITGNNPKSIYFVTGVTPKQVKDLLLDHEQKQQADNIVAFGGVVIAPFIQREGIKSVEIPIAALPDGFDYKTEMQSTAVAYANALNGVTYLDLMPMTGQRAGSSAQSQVVDDQSAQKDTLNADLIDTLNDDELYKVMPDAVTFYVKGNDMADRERMAKVTLAFSQAAALLVEKCMIQPQIIADWLIENEILSPDENSEKYNTLEANENDASGARNTSGMIAPPKPVAPQPDGAKPTPNAIATKETQETLRTLADTIRALVKDGERVGEKQLQHVFNVVLPEHPIQAAPVVNVTNSVPVPSVALTHEIHVPPLAPPPIMVHNALPELNPTFNVSAPNVQVTNDIAPATAQVTVMPAPQGDTTETIDVTQRDSNGLVQQFVKRITRR